MNNLTNILYNKSKLKLYKGKIMGLSEEIKQMDSTEEGHEELVKGSVIAIFSTLATSRTFTLLLESGVLERDANGGSMVALASILAVAGLSTEIFVLKGKVTKSILNTVKSGIRNLKNKANDIGFESKNNEMGM